MRYAKPKLVFKRVEDDPLALDYGNAYYPGCFTPTGIQYDNDDYYPMLVYCRMNGIEEHPILPRLLFKSQQDMIWFLLQWS